MDVHRRQHGVLPGVSTGCPPERGWLHTRYAPVRHSHSPEGEIPYDLHVLGLPLAFILSQDQTLHCIIVVLLIILFRVPLLLSSLPCLLLMLASDFQRTFAPLPRCLPSGRKRLQNYSFLHYKQQKSNIFFKKIWRAL